MTLSIGVIAEDNSDVDVIRIILSKYIAQNKYTLRKFTGSGCGKLKSKCTSWIKNLFLSGCNFVVVIHDLDRNKETELRSTISAKIPKNYTKKSVLIIPVEELESWLLTDTQAIKEVFNLKKKPKEPNNPQAVKSPKEHIQKTVWNASRKAYINTIHNSKIVDRISIEKLKKCSSYAELDVFVRTILIPAVENP